jgi:hypothetical protein
MKRLNLAVAAVFIFTDAAAACSICGDGFLRQQSLRQHFADAKLVVHGRLENPKPGPDGVSGTTEFPIATTLKAEAGFTVPAIMIIPRYYPIIGATPSEFVFFCAIAEGKADPVLGVPATAAAAKYLAEAATAKNLAFFLSHLESKDETIAADAFLEFARASDADIAALAGKFDRAKLRKWIAEADESRVGVYALMLGLSGTVDDAAWLAGLLKDQALKSPLYSERLSAVGCLRYLQATRAKESREAILKACATLLADADLCDLAIDDLRRWGWWDLTADVLKLFTEKASPLVKRGIVRYALSCPDADAKAFVERVRGSDPKLLAKVEESLNRK